ncbi:hypothetical protein WG66_007050 [Moniliophthora roreri]|nr:hypothetical protein WG66_007050 [Moniliophthora roreri]
MNFLSLRSQFGRLPHRVTVSNSSSKCRRYLSNTLARKDGAGSTLTPEGAPVTETNRAEQTMKRFWKHVDIEKRMDGYVVTLDKRALKTPSGNTLLLPHAKHLVATLVATEWENTEMLIKPHALPMTSLVSRAIDSLAEKRSRETVSKALLEYMDTDTICFYQDYPEHLVAMQTEHWDPILAWIRRSFGARVNKSDSILFDGQPEDTKTKLAQVLAGFDHWQMAAMERATYASKSFMIGLGLVERFLTIEQASRAARVEVESQIQRWGEVEDTHDVDFQDIRRQLASASCLLVNS